MLTIDEWIVLAELLLISAAVTAVIGVGGQVAGVSFRPWWVLIFSLCFLGVITGWLTGNSRDPAVNAVVPAMLTFVGGLFTYLAFQQPTGDRPTLLASCTLALALPFFVGTLLGSANRAHQDDPNVIFQREAAEEQNRFRLEVLKLENDARLKRLNELP